MIVRFFSFLILLFCLTSSNADAKSENMLHSFAQLPILHEGRVKPLDSFARIQLKRIGGKSHDTAITWLAETLFNPSAAVSIPLFSIKKDSLKQRLNIDPAISEKNLYSYIEIANGIAKTRHIAFQLAQKDASAIDPEQAAFLSLHDNVFTYAMLIRSLSLLLPLTISDDQTSFLELQQTTQTSTSTEDQELALSLILSGGEGNTLFRVIPDEWDSQNNTWHSPWSIITDGTGGPQSSEYLELWRQMALFYRNNDSIGFIHTTKQAAAKNPLPKPKLSTEVFYNNLKPFFWAKIWYGLSLCFAGLWFWRKERRYYRPAFLGLLVGTALSIVGIVLRVYILERPPVATLYESLLFVAFICGLVALFIEWQNKERRGTALTIGSTSGLSLLWLSLIFTTSGETKEVLAAVLNTNFWLATHVLMISIGYAACLMSGIYAHIVLWQKQQGYNKTLLIALALSLFFTAIGTALGGIWADQSWGRFWGWDPKENGALLIVLWLIWVIHGRLSADLKPLAFQSLSAMLPAITALSWFGTNLLGVGLHSYGFTTGLSLGLFAFCGIEIILVTALYLRARRSITNNV